MDGILVDFRGTKGRKCLGEDPQSWAGRYWPSHEPEPALGRSRACVQGLLTSARGQVAGVPFFVLLLFVVGGGCGVGGNGQNGCSMQHA